jgi:lysozyme family protein
MTIEPRKAIFDAVKDQVPGVWNDPGHIHAMDNLLDALGVPRGRAAIDAFARALTVILRHEGGFVNHPKDPGGITNLGVTKATWGDWTGEAVTEADMRALTPEMVGPLYRKNYWDRLCCDDLTYPLALCVFDFGVNAGPARAARYLQKLVGASVDGVIGPATIAATKAYVEAKGIGQAVRMYQEARRLYYRSLPTFPTFGKGWLRRVNEVEAEALT